MTSSPLLRGATLLCLALALPLAACHMDDHETPASQHLAEGQGLIGDVAWYVDYDAALAVATQTGKALWVHFGENPG